MPKNIITQYKEADEFGKLDMQLDKENIPGCWIWCGSVVEKRGKTHPVIYHKGKILYADRLAYARHYGNPCNTIKLKRICTTPNCINPEHLWLDSRSAKFTTKEIKLITTMLNSGQTVRSIILAIGMNSSSGFYRKLKASGVTLVTKIEVANTNGR